MCDVLRWLARCSAKSPAVANIMFHSSELLAGASPYNQKEEDVAGFLARLEEALRGACPLGFTPMTLAQAARAVKQSAPSLSNENAVT